jgi:hypothetical protein
MELPEDVLHLVKEYAQPITRPGWRTLHKMPIALFMDEFKYATHLRYRKSRNNEVFNWLHYIIIFNWYKNRNAVK